jgi:hypothetical protein
VLFPRQYSCSDCNALGNACERLRDNQLAAAGAGGLEVAISAMRTHASHANVQYASCFALGALVENMPQLQTRTGELGGVQAVVTALCTHTDLPLPAERDAFINVWCRAVLRLVKWHELNTHAAVAAGAIEASVAHLCTLDAAPGSFKWACVLLPYLAIGNDHEARAVLAGVLDAMERRVEGTGSAHERDLEASRVQLVQRLQPAAQRHDAAPCAVAGCKRCAAARASGTMCALAGCGSRRRDGGAKSLLRCGTCRAACYCGPAHQREDWGRHKGECGAPPPPRDEEQAAAGGS